MTCCEQDSFFKFIPIGREQQLEHRVFVIILNENSSVPYTVELLVSLMLLSISNDTIAKASTADSYQRSLY